MVDPLFWLGLSILLVAVSITAVLMAALPAFQELSRAARSAEKLFDTLNRELPPTLEAIRLTSLEITELTDDMTEGVQNVGRMTQQVDQGVGGVKQQAKQAQITTRSVVAGFKAALGAFTRPSGRRAAPVPTRPRLPASQAEEFEEIEEIERVEGIEGVEEVEVFEQFEVEVAPIADHQQSARAASRRVEEPSPINAGEIGANQAAIASMEADTPNLPPQNGNFYAPQLRSPGSSSLNLPPSTSPQMPPHQIEARRERQG